MLAHRPLFCVLRGQVGTLASGGIGEGTSKAVVPDFKIEIDGYAHDGLFCCSTLCPVGSKRPKAER